MWFCESLCLHCVEQEVRSWWNYWKEQVMCITSHKKHIKPPKECLACTLCGLRRNKCTARTADVFTSVFPLGDDKRTVVKSFTPDVFVYPKCPFGDITWNLCFNQRETHKGRLLTNNWLGSSTSEIGAPTRPASILLHLLPSSSTLATLAGLPDEVRVARDECTLGCVMAKCIWQNWSQVCGIEDTQTFCRLLNSCLSRFVTTVPALGVAGMLEPFPGVFGWRPSRVLDTSAVHYRATSKDQQLFILAPTDYLEFQVHLMWRTSASYENGCVQGAPGDQIRNLLAARPWSEPLHNHHEE